jgi:hypothetical protein
MSATQKNTDVNRTVDGDTAEGHARVTIEEAEQRTAKKASKKAVALDDAEAEGHRRLLVDESEEARASLKAGRRVAKRTPTIDDDEAEGHGVLKAR